MNTLHFGAVVPVSARKHAVPTQIPNSFNGN
jgi:hypothetical protein